MWLCVLRGLKDWLIGVEVWYSVGLCELIYSVAVWRGVVWRGLVSRKGRVPEF